MSRPPSRSPQRMERSPQRVERSPQPGGGQQRPPSQSGGQRPPQQGSGGGSQRPSADDNKQHTLHYLFDRPGEPVFLPKGDDNAVFDVPSEYIVSIFSCIQKGKKQECPIVTFFIYRPKNIVLLGKG